MILGPHTVTRMRGTVTVDSYHNVDVDWTTPETVDVPGCSFQPGTGTTVLLDREAEMTTAMLWAPIDADIVATDRISYAGSTWNISGVQRWDFPPLAHLVVMLERTAG